MGARRFITIMGLCAGTGIMAASPAMAGDPQAKPKDDPSVRICKMVTPTGSRFSKRICKSAYEWQREEDYAQTRIDEARLPPPPDPSFNHPQ